MGDPEVMDVSRAFSIVALGTALLAGTAACGQGEEGPEPTGTRTQSAPRPSPTETGTPSPTGPPKFEAEISKVTAEQLRHSWRKGCPVPLSGLRMITMPYWGFDEKAHEGGRLVINAKVAQKIAGVFEKLYEDRYPIHKMVPVDEFKGDDFDSIEANNTSAFNCRQATGSSNWSRHAYGMAVDLNPCQNPYVSTSGTIAHPSCKKYYKTRNAEDPGVITAGDNVVKAFGSIGWKWGGYWAGTKDYQHFSDSR